MGIRNRSRSLATEMKLFCRKLDHVVWALLAFFLTAPLSLIAQSGGTGRLESTVFVLDSEGRSFVAGAKVVLSGPSTLEAESDQEGKCVFDNVAPGTYSIQVQFPGLEAAESVTVEAGKTTQSPCN